MVVCGHGGGQAGGRRDLVVAHTLTKVVQLLPQLVVVRTQARLTLGTQDGARESVKS